MLNKIAFRIICLIVVSFLIFPAVAFAEDNTEGEDLSSLETIQTEAESSMPSESSAVTEGDNLLQGILDDTVISDIKNLALTDGASAAALLNAYETQPNFYTVLTDILDSYIGNENAVQYTSFLNAINLQSIELSDKFDSSVLNAVPAADFGSSLSVQDGKYLFTYPGQISEQANNAFEGYLVQGVTTVKTAFLFVPPTGTVSSDVYDTNSTDNNDAFNMEKNIPQKTPGQAGLFLNVAQAAADGVQLLSVPDGASKVSVVVFRDASQNIISAGKAVYTINMEDAPAVTQTKEETVSVASQEAETDLPYVEGQMLVVFDDSVTESQENAAVQNYGVETQEKDEISLVLLDSDTTVEQAVEELNENPDVELAQPNYIYSLLAETEYEPLTTIIDDSYFSYQWYLDNIGMREAWDYSKTSNTVKVAVLDTGIDTSHPDLVNNIVYAWDVVNNAALTVDTNGHGTHVAGIIAAQANNAIGIAGVSYNAGIIAIDVFESSGYTNSFQLCKGYDVAMSQGARVINMSLGGYGDTSTDYYDILLKQKIDAAAAAGIVTVCAGGNGDDDDNPITDPIFPGDYKTCISVVPTDMSNIRTSYADYNQYKDISAPGDYILSTVPGGYGYKGGSSMATPVISGVIADMIAANPSLTVAQIKSKLYNYATDLGSAGRDDYYGYGKVNAAATIYSVVDNIAPTLTGIMHSASPSTTPTFTVTAQGVTDDISGVAKVSFAVWSENGGQDDLRWYDGTNDGSGNWTVTVNAANHKNDVGKYFIDIYGTDTADNTGMMGGTTIVMDHRDYTAPKLTGITHSASPSLTSTFTVTAQGVTDDKSNVAKVRFAVWSENGGQDDLRWYDGVNNSGNWMVTVNAANHKNDVGKYFIDIYGTDTVGNTGMMGGTTIIMDHLDHTAPKLTGITHSASPSTAPTFTVTAQGVTDDKSNVAKVRFAVWSENGGQDDLRWYDGANSSGNWTVSVNAANHKDDVGKYFVDIYGTDTAGNTGFMGGITMVMDHRDYTAPKLTGITRSISPCTTQTFFVTANSVSDDKSGVAKIRFAVWSENSGQDDLRWYDGIKDSSNNWTINVNVANHKYDTGKYFIDIYGTDNTGNTGYMGGTVIQMNFTDSAAPKLTGITHSTSPSTSPTFTVTATGVTDDKTGVAKIRFAVWSENGGQDDLRWYDGVNNSGNWTVTVNAANHKDDIGKYFIDIYGTDIYGNTGFMGGVVMVMDHRDHTAPKLTSITHSASPSTTPTFTVTAQGVTDDKSNVSKVRFAVWSESGGQDDLRWYDGANSSGNWTVTVNAANHKDDVGKYFIDIYGTDTAGNTGFMGGITMVMDHRDYTAPKLTGITRSTSPCTTQTFFVTALGVADDKSGVAKIRFAVWSENNGQDDLRWYDGIKDSSNNWTINVNVANHKYDTGKYFIDIYGTDNTGNTGYMGGTVIQMNFTDSAAPKLTGITHSTSPSTSPTFTVTATGVTDDKTGVAKIRFAVWSENGGQDDLRWYDGVNNSGNWTVTVNAANHKDDIGKYFIDIYGTDIYGNTGFMGGITMVMDHR